MDRPPKKSESLEIRLPYETKLAFMARCRDDGVSASEVLRTLIGARLESPPAAPPRSPWRRRVQRAAGLAVALGVAATAVPSLAGSVDRRGFAQLDTDAGGDLSRSELARGASLQLRLEIKASGLEIGRTTIAPADPPLPAEDRALFDRLLQRRFASLDADGDGAVSFTEFRSR